MAETTQMEMWEEEKEEALLGQVLNSGKDPEEEEDDVEKGEEE